MTRLPRIRRWLDSLVTAPPVVPRKRVLRDRVKAGVSWAFVSTVIAVLRLVLWFLDRKGK
jgi:hypothetical protein